jgi:hypothetical protein
MQSNETEKKFYDTYGKNASFEPLIEETPSQIFGTETTPQPRSVIDSVKKYLALTVFIALIGTFLLIGGVVVITIMAIMLLGMLIRALLFGPGKSSSSFMIIKK